MSTACLEISLFPDSFSHALQVPVSFLVDKVPAYYPFHTAVGAKYANFLILGMSEVAYDPTSLNIYKVTKQKRNMIG